MAKQLEAAAAAKHHQNQSEPLIRIRGVKKSYQTGAITTQVLHGLDLDIHAGEFVAIVGSSGSGKSTLMNILGCLDKPTEGDYHFRGHAVADMDRDELAKLRRSAFGFVFQQYNLLGGATALANAELPAGYTSMGTDARHERANALLKRLGLEDRTHHKPSELSGGQQQRVSIARALMNGGEIILADEPTGALDSQSGKEVMALLKELSAEGHTIILITHDHEVAAHADRVIELKDGEIVKDAWNRERSPQVQPPSGPGAGDPSPVMDAGRAFITALTALRQNIFRTALTLLGIVIGVAAVISMLAIGQGARQDVVDRISAMGSNLLTVFPGGTESARTLGGVATLIPEDVDAINELPLVLAAVPELTGNRTLRRSGFDKEAQVNATYPEFPIARQWTVEKGSFFTPRRRGTVRNRCRDWSNRRPAIIPRHGSARRSYVD